MEYSRNSNALMQRSNGEVVDPGGGGARWGVWGFISVAPWIHFAAFCSFSQRVF